MSHATERQAELAAFLRTRRAGLRRADFGLPELRGGRTHGLRREEVAYLAGVSVTWYTWLEQGRSAHPSRQVVDALARELRLSEAEHAYALALAGYQAPVPSPAPVVPPHLQRLLDGWDRAPAFAITSRWDIVAWNAAYGLLYPGVAAAGPGGRNLLRSLFTDPYVRRMLPEWERDSAHFVAEFRADHAAHLADPRTQELVERLRRESAEFDRLWSRHDIERFASRLRCFHHPAVGDLQLEVHRLAPADDPALLVIVYSPLPGSPSARALDRLLAPTDTGGAGYQD